MLPAVGRDLLGCNSFVTLFTTGYPCMLRQILFHLVIQCGTISFWEGSEGESLQEQVRAGACALDNIWWWQFIRKPCQQGAVGSQGSPQDGKKELLLCCCILGSMMNRGAHFMKWGISWKLYVYTFYCSREMRATN